MAHDVFVSYATEDKPIADAAVATLEAARIRCWIAPRDVLPGADWPSSIVEAINRSRIMVLIFSSRSNDAKQVMREVNLAADRGIPIIPFRIEDVPLSPSMRFFMGLPHWLEALTPPLERHLQSLAGAVTEYLQVRPGSGLEDELTAFSQVTYETSVAETKLKEIVARYAGDPKAHQYLGEFYNRCQEYEKAIEAFKQGIQLDAGNALLYWDLALAYQQVDKRRAAADSLEKAVSLGLDPSRQRYAATLLEALQRTEP